MALSVRLAPGERGGTKTQTITPSTRHSHKHIMGIINDKLDTESHLPVYHANVPSVSELPLDRK